MVETAKGIVETEAITVIQKIVKLFYSCTLPLVYNPNNVMYDVISNC